MPLCAAMLLLTFALWLAPHSAAIAQQTTPTELLPDERPVREAAPNHALSVKPHVRKRPARKHPVRKRHARGPVAPSRRALPKRRTPTPYR
jgi:hypothetical protein